MSFFINLMFLKSLAENRHSTFDWHYKALAFGLLDFGCALIKLNLGASLILFVRRYHISPSDVFVRKCKHILSQGRH
jgi:hypothetical protein